MSYYDTPPDGPNLGSPCCGTDFEETVSINLCCYKCEKCHDIFEEPELDYEYNERMRENAAEDRMDEERLGL